MSKPIKSEEFFEEPTEQSFIKAAIVSKYFKPWAKIILGVQARYGRKKKIAYIDLFAGPGKYNDGSLSTPLLVVEHALKDREIKESLVCLFNDANKNNILTLERNLSSLPNIESLKYKPDFQNETIQTGKLFENMNIIPTLLFADPWGYSGLSLELLGSVLQQWGCECIFFFNYKRINAALTNPSVKEKMDAIFGVERANKLRLVLSPLSPPEREKKIIEEMQNALIANGANHVLAYPFKRGSGKGVTHHIIFATKSKRGYTIMKEIMSKLGTEVTDGFSLLEHDPSKQIGLVFEDPIEKLATELLKEFSGETINTIGVFNKHNVGKPYLLRNYKKALMLLEKKSIVSTKPSIDERPPNTFGDNVIITFP
ncbi:MAG: three-Cys-motif partner protein TcmP [Ignavibacteriota bacterium]